VGDEPALLARALPEVPIVVCADRYRGGRLAEEELNVNVHILDDGFQHLALERDVDVVVLDVTQELSEDALLPAGRLREPVRALRRADVVVFSRTELGDPGRLMDQVAQINPHPRMFRSTTKLRVLQEMSGHISTPDEWRGKPVQAFCGIGNPQAFFADLRRWGFTVASEEVFPDHHLYTQGEFHRLNVKARQAGAKALITTEKDVLNFPSYCKPDLPLLVCEIQAEVVEAGEFEAMLVERLR
jgi:tetraacyldisaccharide 4'-kinase